MARQRTDGKEVIQIAAEHDYYANIVEVEETDDEGETVAYRYELRYWFYGSYSVKCSWKSKEQLEFTEDAE